MRCSLTGSGNKKYENFKPHYQHLFYCVRKEIPACIYDPGDSFLYIVNRTQADVYIIGRKTELLSKDSKYDGQAFLNSPLALDDTLEVAQSGPNGWKNIIKETQGGKIRLYVFSSDDLKVYKGNDTLIKKKKYKMVTLSREDLDSLNWVVTLR